MFTLLYVNRLELQCQYGLHTTTFLLQIFKEFISIEVSRSLKLLTLAFKVKFSFKPLKFCDLLWMFEPS